MIRSEHKITVIKDYNNVHVGTQHEEMLDKQHEVMDVHHE